MFVLAAEYVSPNLRAIMILILWTSSTLALVTLAGIAYIIQNRESLMLTMTFPLLLAILLWRLVVFQRLRISKILLDILHLWVYHAFFPCYVRIKRLRDGLLCDGFWQWHRDSNPERSIRSYSSIPISRQLHLHWLALRTLLTSIIIFPLTQDCPGVSPLGHS